MIVLITFAFVAGAATAMSPCALPVLPAVFSAGVTGGRRRPLGIATGLAASFTFAVVVLVYLLAALGLPDSLMRTVAVVVLLTFGLSLLVPKAAAIVETFFSRMASPSTGRVMRKLGAGESKDGFWSGVVIGSGLGLVYSPCAGPILAGVITATASQSFSTSRLTVAAAYGIGSAVTFYALMLGGRKLAGPLARRSGKLQASMGVAMVLVAAVMFANLDVKFQTKIADDLPGFLTNPTGALERSSTIGDSLQSVRGGRGPKFESPRSRSIPSNLPILGVAPEITGTQEWFNTDGKKLTLAELRGKVVLIDFWTYTCINCLRTLPHLREWWSRYRGDGLVIVGVHTPEFPFERSAKNVATAIKQNRLTYPVVQDNKYATWNAFGNQYWPAKYLIDANGKVRYTHFGEGEYDKTETAIRSLLTEAGSRPGKGGAATASEQGPAQGPVTPETYLGSERAESFRNGTLRNGTATYRGSGGKLPTDFVELAGRWTITPSQAQAAGANARLRLRFRAREVYLVLTSPGRTRSVEVWLDGKPVRAKLAGADVHGGRATIADQRLYKLVKLPIIGTHTLELRPETGVSGYAFTFG